MILIQCVQSKQDEPLPAKKLYDSTYFDAMKRYAEASDDGENNDNIWKGKHKSVPTAIRSQANLVEACRRMYPDMTENPNPGTQTTL